MNKYRDFDFQRNGEEERGRELKKQVAGARRKGGRGRKSGREGEWWRGTEGEGGNWERNREGRIKRSLLTDSEVSS